MKFNNQQRGKTEIISFEPYETGKGIRKKKLGHSLLIAIILAYVIWSGALSRLPVTEGCINSADLNTPITVDSIMTAGIAKGDKEAIVKNL